MSSDGSIVAIGAPRQGRNSYGEVKVYRFQSGAWVPLGQTISGRDYYQYIHVSAGQSVSLSSDGTRLAVGFTGVNSVYIFDLNNNNQWTLVGGIIEGDNPDGDGTTPLVIPFLCPLMELESQLVHPNIIKYEIVIILYFYMGDRFEFMSTKRYRELRLGHSWEQI